MLIRCYSPPGQLHYALSLSCYGYIPVIIMNPADPGGAPWPLSSLGNGLYSCRNACSNRNLCSIQDPVPLLLAVLDRLVEVEPGAQAARPMGANADRGSALHHPVRGGSGIVCQFLDT